MALNEDRGTGRRTILKSEMIGWLVDCNVCGERCRRGAQFENSQMIRCQVDCNKCGMNCRTTQILRLENDRIASRLQSMWKEMQDNAQFENS